MTSLRLRSSGSQDVIVKTSLNVMVGFSCSLLFSGSCLPYRISTGIRSKVPRLFSQLLWLENPGPMLDSGLRAVFRSSPYALQISADDHYDRIGQALCFGSAFSEMSFCDRRDFSNL
jgi:hypothetical protein